MIRRGYKMSGAPQQRSLPNVHNKDDKWDILLEQFSSGLITLTSVHTTLISWRLSGLGTTYVIGTIYNLVPKRLRTLKGGKSGKVLVFWWLLWCDIWALDIFQILNVKCSKGPLSVIPEYWSFIANCQDFILNSTFHTGRLNSLKLWESLLTCFKASSFKEQHFASEIVSDKHGMDSDLITIFYV